MEILPLIPARAGIRQALPWIPARAGMSGGGSRANNETFDALEPVSRNASRETGSAPDLIRGYFAARSIRKPVPAFRERALVLERLTYAAT